MLKTLQQIFAASKPQSTSKPAQHNGKKKQQAAMPAVGSDRLGAIVFHTHAYWDTKPAHVGAPWLDERLRRLASIKTGGATNLAAGLRLARPYFEALPASIGRNLIVATDGEDNLDGHAVNGLATGLKKLNVRITALAFPGANVQRLRTFCHEVVPVSALADAVKGLEQIRREHRVFVDLALVDGSISMTSNCGGQSRLAVVSRALQHHLTIKRARFA